MYWTELEIFGDKSNLPPAARGRRAKRDQAPGSGAQLPTILVVDDQQLIADTLVDILNSAGFDATAAYDGRAALQFITRVEPDYVLSDIVMPSMNGVDLAISIRKKWPQTRILLLSGQAGVGDLLREADKQGFEFELIAKPIHPEKLIRRLKDL